MSELRGFVWRIEDPGSGEWLVALWGPCWFWSARTPLDAVVVVAETVETFGWRGQVGWGWRERARMVWRWLTFRAGMVWVDEHGIAGRLGRRAARWQRACGGGGA